MESKKSKTLPPLAENESRSSASISLWETRQEIEAKNYDLKAVNPNAKNNEDTRTPEELIALIEQKGCEVSEALKMLRGIKS